MTDLDEADLEDVPIEYRCAVIVNTATAAELREEIDGMVGLDSTTWGPDQPAQFTKEQLAAVFLALGGPQ